MASNSMDFRVTGLTGLERDMARLASPEPYVTAGREALDRTLHDTTATVELSTPVGTGDYRRPAGALRDSTRDQSEMTETGDVWNGIVLQGYEGDGPQPVYAAYVRWTNFRKRGVDNFGEAIEATEDLYEDAVNAPFDEVFARVEW